MGSFRLAGSSLSGLFGHPVTVRYPAEDTQRFKSTAGHVMNARPHDCILCSACQRRCPTDCIVVDREARTWTIDPYDCVTCASCVRACPKSCIDMYDTYASAALEKVSVTVDIPEKPEKPKPSKTDVAPEADKPADTSAVKPEGDAASEADKPAGKDEADGRPNS